MKKNNMLWVALSMMGALMMTACGKNNIDLSETPEVPPVPLTSKTIPYTVTVTDDATRATVDSDNKTIRFAEGDKLYVSGLDIKGILSLQAGDEGKTSGATFSGDLTYKGEGSPADDLALTATLVSAQQTVGTQVTVDGAGAVTVNYPTTIYCTSVNDAVQKYSDLKGTSTYSAKSFTLTQNTAFLNFKITFEDGTTTGKTLTAVVKNGASQIASANVTTVTEDTKVLANFVLPIAKDTKLSGATVKMGDKDALSISNATLTGKVYNVKKTQPIDTDAISGKFSVSATKKVYFSKGNLQATTSNNGTNWTWHFGPTQYARVGEGANACINGNGTVTDAGNGKNIDLFGWSTENSYLGIKPTNNNNDQFTGTFNEWGSHANVIDGIGTGWYTLTSGEWRYLLNPDNNASNYRQGNRFAKAKLDGTRNGIILLPDDWKTSYYTLNYINDKEANFTVNAIPYTTWPSLEAHGAVFLPAGGQRNSNNDVKEFDVTVHYWSSTPAASNVDNYTVKANQMYVNSSTVAPDSGAGRSNGFSVRLVRNVDIY